MRLKVDATVETREPVLEVEGTIAPGQYRVRLVVVNNRGQTSLPADHSITVRSRGTPVIPRRPIAPPGGRVIVPGRG